MWGCLLTLVRTQPKFFVAVKGSLGYTRRAHLITFHERTFAISQQETALPHE